MFRASVDGNAHRAARVGKLNGIGRHFVFRRPSGRRFDHDRNGRKFFVGKRKFKRKIFRFAVFVPFERQVALFQVRAAAVGKRHGKLGCVRLVRRDRSRTARTEYVGIRVRLRVGGRFYRIKRRNAADRRAHKRRGKKEC